MGNGKIDQIPWMLYAQTHYMYDTISHLGQASLSFSYCYTSAGSHNWKMRKDQLQQREGRKEELENQGKKLRALSYWANAVAVVLHTIGKQEMPWDSASTILSYPQVWFLDW